MSETIVCPVCRQAANCDLFARSEAIDLRILDLVARENPGWQPEDGLCPACVQYALGLYEAQGNDPHNTIYRLELAYGDPGLLVEPIALPIPMRVPSNPRFTGRGVTIAFLDAGFYDHPDLTTPHNRIKVVVDACSDPVAENADLHNPAIQHAHGLMTSVVAAGNGSMSGGRYRGLAPDAELVLVRVADQNGCITEEAIARALEWVLANRERYGIDLVNISLAGDSETWTWLCELDRLADKAVEQGLLVLAAAGNSPEAPILPPASAPEVLTVGGVNDYNHPDPENVGLWHSTCGPTVAGHVKPEILAPSIWLAGPIPPGSDEAGEAERLRSITTSGNGQMTTVAAELGLLPRDNVHADPAMIRGALVGYMAGRGWVSGGYKYVDGTSFAAPIVCSVAAQMKEANPALDGRELKRLLIQTARQLPGVEVTRQGAGVLRAGRAVGAALRARGGAAEGLPISPEVAGNTLTFVYYAPEAQSVALTADFNGWLPELSQFEQVRPGVWCHTARGVRSGRYRYKFLVDGEQWIDDPENIDKEPDGYGGISAVVTVP